jgi:hypothetical protein
MKIEFLKSGSPECPWIRLYKFKASEAYELRRIALQLARGAYRVIPLQEGPTLSPIVSCELTLRLGEEGQGVFETAPLKFSWVLSKSGWIWVAGLIRPFSRGQLSGFQWLSSKGGIQILLSPDGQW